VRQVDEAHLSLWDRSKTIHTFRCWTRELGTRKASVFMIRIEARILEAERYPYQPQVTGIIGGLNEQHRRKIPRNGADRACPPVRQQGDVRKWLAKSCTCIFQPHHELDETCLTLSRSAPVSAIDTPSRSYRVSSASTSTGKGCLEVPAREGEYDIVL
jgi:hypothetical protein